MWISLGLGSALFLGLYDLCKKKAVQDNAVLPVLWLATVSSALTLGLIFGVSRLMPDALPAHRFALQPFSWENHLLVALKSLIVSGSWILSYFALKHLPISIVSPIRSTSPFWTLIGAILIFGERPNLWQWFGLVVILLSYYFFSVLGKAEGICFKTNRWVWFVVGATLLGTASGLYDKQLLTGLNLPPFTMQCWFTCYLVVILGGVVSCLWWPRRKAYTPFRWHWSIFGVGALLVIADAFYFFALQEEGALLSLLSALRRSSVVVSFVAGSLLFREQNRRRKFLALSGVLAGVLLIALTS